LFVLNVKSDCSGSKHGTLMIETALKDNLLDTLKWWLWNCWFARWRILVCLKPLWQHFVLDTEKKR